MEILGEEPITNVEAREILEKRSEENELKYEQNNALEHLRKFATLDVKKIKKLKEELSKIEKLNEKQVVAICNLLPKDKEDLRVILQKGYNTLKEEEINLILEKANSL